MAGVKPAYLALMLGDNITTIQKYYVHVGFGMTLADGFETIPKMIEAKSIEDPARAQLHRLAAPTTCLCPQCGRCLRSSSKGRHCRRQTTVEAPGRPVTDK